MASVIARHDWGATSLGPMDTWSGELRSLLRVLLTSRFSMWLGWGPDLAFFYNDAYRRDTLGMKHPWALGRPAREVWAEAWDELSPRIDHVMAEGLATWDEALELRLERGGYPEETYHTFSYSPIPADDGSVQGLLCVVTEETHRVVVGRRMATLRRLASDLSAHLSEDEMLAALGDGLQTNLRDLPFACVYLEDAPGTARLACTSGIAPGAAGAPGTLAGRDDAWPLPADGGALVLDDVERRFGDLPAGAWDRPPAHAVVVPLAGRAGEGPKGWFVAGLNPLRPVEQEYVGWVELLAGQIAASLATARAYEDERRRAEALAELDRAKTTFFSDISHELRTPLTLMSGPLQEAVDRPDLPADLREHLGFAHRGSGRLLKLVNTLLEFARIEAGRVEARFEPMDLAEFTGDIASAFRSGAQAMGLRMTVDCPPLPEPVYVDPEMWEKIVSNLLSNALKFTHAGEVRLRLELRDGHAVLRVRDTGIGIDEDHLPQLFQRFHRVRGAAGRTHEGSGIGLALVSELAQLHGGDASVTSEPGAGSEFTVRVPRGRAHIDEDHLADGPGRRDGATTRLFLQEVMSWTGQVEDSPEPPADTDNPLAAATGRILLADDNADMRAYLSRLLGARYRVDAVADGEQALRSVAADPPDLIVSDVMMPRVDGLELVRRLRADPATARVPVMLLSARAGEEASAEGLAAGADDYLLKPFTARELLARVGAHVALGRARREAEDRERAARERIEALQARTARDEQRLRLLATASTTCLWATDRGGVVREPSSSWEEFTGQATDAYLGPDRGWLDAFAAADRDRLVAWFTEEAAPVEAVARLRRGDGTGRRVRLNAVPVVLDDGSVAEWVASATDVEDELRLREEHERQHRELRVAQTQIAQAT
ncbi:MAG: response regulator, partial [Thermoleophilia bacterium]|nr:response regulator [Thermoleophilia bacterium]